MRLIQFNHNIAKYTVCDREAQMCNKEERPFENGKRIVMDQFMARDKYIGVVISQKKMHAQMGADQLTKRT